MKKTKLTLPPPGGVPQGAEHKLPKMYEVVKRVQQDNRNHNKKTIPPPLRDDDDDDDLTMALPLRAEYHHHRDLELASQTGGRE